MNDSHDNEAGWFRDTPESRRLLEAERAKVDAMEAGFVTQATARLEALLDRLPDSTHVMAAKADLRAVLAENETMRQQLAGLKVVWESIYSNDEYDTKAEALAAATKDRFGTAAVDEDVTWRLVGEWQPAGPAQDEQAATGGNDNNKGN